MMRLLKLFKKDTKEYPDDKVPSTMDRIADIQSRIAAIRSSYGWDQEPYKDVAPITEHAPPRELRQDDSRRDNERATTDQKLNDLKAKLLKK